MSPTNLKANDSIGPGAYVQTIEFPPTPQQYWQAGDANWTNAFTRLFASGKTAAYVPPSSTPYQINSGLTMPVSMTSLTLDPGATIQASATISGAMLNVGDLSSQKRYGIVSGGTWDCNSLADDGIKVPWHWGQTLSDLTVKDHKRHGIVLGDTNAATASNEHKVRGVNTYRSPVSAPPVGSYGVWLAYSHDGDCSDVTVTSAETSFKMDSLGSRFISCHGWSSGSTVHKICFQDDGGNNDYIACEADNPSQYGFSFSQYNCRIIGGFSLVNTPSINNLPIGIHIATAGNHYQGTIWGHAWQGNNGTNWLQDSDCVLVDPNLTIGACIGYGVTTTRIIGRNIFDTLAVNNGLQVNALNSGPSILGGAGTPNGFVSANVGDLWIRKDQPGTTGARLYMCTGGTAWTATSA